MHTPCYSSFKTVITAAEPAYAPVFSEPSALKRFRRFIETADWDQALIRKEKWGNRGCWFLLGLAFLYFAPVLARLIHP
jgi:hypothetical protein